MPRCGIYEYPARELEDCIRYLKEAHDKAKDSVIKRQHFAENIGMSHKSGSFGLLTGSMVFYGLIETGEGNVKYTDLTKKILFGEPKEKEQGKALAVRRVKLFADIFDKYGTTVSDEQIRSFLRQKADVEIQDASRLASEIGKLLKKVSPYVKPTTKLIGVDQNIMPQDQEAINEQQYLKTKFGIIPLVNSKSVDYAIKLLQEFKNDFFEEHKKNEKSDGKR